MQRFVYPILCILFFLSSLSLMAQSSYQKGWQALDEADVEGAIVQFKAALKEEKNVDQALLCLNLLEGDRNHAKEALAYFQQYMERNPDFYPALFAMWNDAGMISLPSYKSKGQLALLQQLAARKDNKLARATLYHLCFHYRMSNDFEQMKVISKELSTLNTWQFVGPFDNVMNNGFDKSFGPLEHPEPTASFTSKYGAPVSWFEPRNKSLEGYVFIDNYFLSSSSIVYGQTFVELPQEQSVVLKLGYSGSLKVWINDQEIYAQKKLRRTELDFYAFEVKLNKGYNRILVQLGDFNENTASYSLRLTDLNGEALSFPMSASPKKYTQQPIQVKAQPHFAVTHFEQQAKDQSDLLNQLLLAKTYERSFDLQRAENIYTTLYEKHPKNYFVLRQLILLYEKTANTTSQNKYFGLFEKYYPESLDILDAELQEAFKDKDKKKYEEKTNLYLSKYGNPYLSLSFQVGLASLENDVSTILSLTDSLYKRYPLEKEVVLSKFKLEKDYYSNPEKAKQVLIDYLQRRYNYSFVVNLAELYLKEGNFDQAMAIYENQQRHAPATNVFLKKMVNIESRQQKYDEAIAISEQILAQRPSDYLTIKDIAVLSEFKKDKVKALKFYEKSIAFNPFSFETNEKIRTLKDLPKAMTLVPEVKPHELIKAYEAAEKSDKKESYDILLDTKSNILFKSSALGTVHSYIVKINTESAIEEWQRVSFGSDSNFRFKFKETKTIKKDGTEIAAERNQMEVVFTNLEVGDYVFISYAEVQTGGGKTTKFVSDEFALNTYNPSYLQDFNLYAEEGIAINHTTSLGKIKPQIENKEGFVHYNWSATFPPIIKSENFAPPFYDLSETVHYSVNQSWAEIVDWYSDLSSQQAEPDYTVEQIAQDLLGEHQGSEDEKFRLIYDFVCKNIQYSSIDFRQSGYIPQRASNTYHSRLGDCKDVSTLFVSIARAAGLKANLVLINTSDNGKKSVLLPSLNFNHCIVKTYTDHERKFLELTDPNLPYGHLYYYHKMAPILEIPHRESTQGVSLAYLDFNDGYQNWVKRTTEVAVGSDNKIKISAQATFQGTTAANVCYRYYNEDATRRKELLKERFATRFKSNLSVEAVSFPHLEPLSNRAAYHHKIIVENDILKLGSMKTFKVPFSDVLIAMSVFEEGERSYGFDYVRYEDSELYEETITVTLPAGSKFIEVPKNAHFEFNKNVYDLKFEKTTDTSLTVSRSYHANREQIKLKDFGAFKDFMTQVNEAENTHLLFK